MKTKLFANPKCHRVEGILKELESNFKYYPISFLLPGLGVFFVFSTGFRDRQTRQLPRAPSKKGRKNYKKRGCQKNQGGAEKIKGGPKKLKIR